jgi:hypothetical protein
MRLYLAHNWAARDWLREEIVPSIGFLGHEVTSTWITRDDWESLGNATEAINDLRDIDHSDYVVLFTDNFGDTPGQGKYVEFGYALGTNKKIVLVGRDARCVFFSIIPDSLKFEGLGDFYEWLRRITIN